MALKFNNQPLKASILLPGSKSISNRLLILKQVLGLDTPLENLSTAKDTIDLIKALEVIQTKKEAQIDVGHAGTDMRFLTAMLSITEGHWQLSGSERLKERPIKPLVDALKTLGADITYSQKEGFPPLIINGKKLKGGNLEIDGSVSSQFITALLLIAPKLVGGLALHLKNNIVSWPYIKMSLDLLHQFGIETEINGQQITVHPESKKIKPPVNYIIESDWSSASYWFSMCALSPASEITLNSLFRESLQGDSVLPELYSRLGVKTNFGSGNIILTHTRSKTQEFEFDFTSCPDIAQTIAVTCLGLKIPCKLAGLSTLKHKETDRILALKTELEKCGAKVQTTNSSLTATSYNNLPPAITIQTYTDHRMAMSFAPLALIHPNITIQYPEVVEKSYPEFWSHLQKTGISFN